MSTELLYFRYSELLGGKMKIILVTNDQENRRKAQEDLGLEAMSLKGYASSRVDCKDLLDLVAQQGCSDDEKEGKLAICLQNIVYDF